VSFGSPWRRRPERSWVQVAAGVAAVSATAVLGVLLHFHPGPNAVDRLGFRLLPPAIHPRFFNEVTRLGAVTALVLGSLGAATVAWFARPRVPWRALACLAGPPAAAAFNQLVLKPMVGRLYVGEHSFASGSVTVVAALSAAWTLAVPRRLRPLVAGLGTLSVALIIVAVITLKWHYPSDALVGALFGAGTVLLVDSATWLLTGRASHASRRGAAGGSSVRSLATELGLERTRMADLPPGKE
jgi:membrane-associated phospholipid phosphatase